MLRSFCRTLPDNGTALANARRFCVAVVAAVWPPLFVDDDDVVDGTDALESVDGILVPSVRTCSESDGLEMARVCWDWNFGSFGQELVN